MNNRIMNSRFVAVLLVVILSVSLFSVSSTAASEDITGSITITLQDSNNKALSGVSFRIYQIATAYTERNGIRFVYTDAFAGNGMPAGDFSDTYLPVHLTAFAQRNSLAFTEKTTDVFGMLVFDNLPLGAYLIVPVGRTEGYLAPNPFIVTVPGKDPVNNQWDHHIDASPKIEDTNGEYHTTSLTVKKRWKSTDDIPTEIAVVLLKDGEIAETVLLNAQNNWSYGWTDLDAHHTWSVAEAEVPAEYTVTYVASELTVYIINTHEDYEEEPSLPPVEPPPVKPPEDELIDTGQLNWPVPVFAIAGLLLFSVGWAMLNFGKKDEETA